MTFRVGDHIRVSTHRFGGTQHGMTGVIIEYQPRLFYSDVHSLNIRVRYDETLHGEEWENTYRDEDLEYFKKPLREKKGFSAFLERHSL